MKVKHTIRFLPVERAAAVYCAATCLLMVAMMPRLADPVGMLLMRVEWLAFTIGLILLQHLVTKHLRQLSLLPPLFALLRVIGQLAWLAKWYPDMYEFNRAFPNLDHVFASIEQQLFGCQPSLVFSQALPGGLWSEAFNLGYWSYFPMIGAVVIALFWQEYLRPLLATTAASPRPQAMSPHPSASLSSPASVSFSSPSSALFMQVATTIVTAFFLFYVIYIFVPVAGPQFYFQAVGVDEIVRGHFPALGTYFSHHTDMLPSPGYADGLFYHLVSSAQATGERPIAAFPSSHVGISTIVILLSRRYAPAVTKYLLPFYVLLCCATVYIQAHYLIDVLAGLLAAPIVLYVAMKIVAAQKKIF